MSNSTFCVISDKENFALLVPEALPGNLLIVLLHLSGNFESNVKILQLNSSFKRVAFNKITGKRGVQL